MIQSFTFTKVFIWIVFMFFLYYAVFWFLVLFEPEPKVKRKRYKQWPHVTIAIPLFNEEKSVEPTVRSVFGLDYPRSKLHVVCINDGSTDKSLQVLRRLKKEFPIEIMSQTNKGKYVALNKALAKTKSPFFVSLDADSMVEPDALKILLGEFTKKEVAASMPIMKVDKPKNWLMRWQQLEYMTSVYLKTLMQERDCIPVAPGPFTVYRTEAVKAVGGYRKAHYVEDLELALRLQAHHYILRQSDAAIISTRAPQTLGQYYRQRLRWYGGTFRNAFDYRWMVLRRAYKDFGVIQIPVLMSAGFLAMFAVFFVYLAQAKSFWYNLKYLYLTNFDLWTYFSTMTFTWDVLNTDFFVFACTVTLLLLSALLIKLALNTGRESFTRKHVPSTVTFLLFYSTVTAAIWFMVGLRTLMGKSGWTR